MTFTSLLQHPITKLSINLCSNGLYYKQADTKTGKLAACLFMSENFRLLREVSPDFYRQLKTIPDWIIGPIGGLGVDGMATLGLLPAYITSIYEASVNISENRMQWLHIARYTASVVRLSSAIPGAIFERIEGNTINGVPILLKFVYSDFKKICPMEHVEVFNRLYHISETVETTLNLLALAVQIYQNKESLARGYSWLSKRISGLIAH